MSTSQLYGAILMGIFCLTASGAVAEIDKDGPRLSSGDAAELFEKICVQSDPRSAASGKAAKKLGFVPIDEQTLFNSDLNTELSLVTMNGAGICALIFLHEGGDSAYLRSLAEIAGMKRKGSDSDFTFNGNGQRMASYARLKSGYPSSARTYLMVVGSNADDYDK